MKAKIIDEPLGIPIVRCISAFLVIFLALNLGYSQTLLRVVILPGKVRDLKEYWDYSGMENAQLHAYIKGGHPDFETWMGLGCKGAVQNRINTHDMASIFPNDNRGPQMAGSGCYDDIAGHSWDAMNGGVPYAGPVFFRDWYNDTTVNDTIPNRPFLVPLHFNFYSDCRMVFKDSIFFPIDSGKEFYSLSDPAQPPFGKLQTDYQDHDYGFTLEFHAQFTYLKGFHQVFLFTGDDDVWVFVNDSLLIDLGGSHAEQSDSINLDALPTGFLTDGATYPLDFFSAERHIDKSNIRITTSIILENEGTAVDTTVVCNGRAMALPPATFPPQWYIDWHTPTISGYIVGADGMPVKNATITLVFSNGAGTVQTDSRGYFSIRVPRHWSGTVTPQASGWAFTPVNTTITNDTAAMRINFAGVDTTTKAGARTTPTAAPREFGLRSVVSAAGVDFQIAVEKRCGYCLDVYDVGGRELWQSAATDAAPGYYRASWHTPESSIASHAVFFVRLRRGNEQIVKLFTPIPRRRTTTTP